MKELRIKDICDKGSSNLKQKDVEGKTGQYPVYGASGIISHIDSYHQEDKYIAIVKDGSGIGRVTFMPAQSSVIGTMQYILPKEGFNINYIGYCLQSLDLSKYKQGAAIPHIYFRDYGERIVKVSEDINEQQAIVDYLDSSFAKIDAMKANAEKALNEAKALFQASLKEMLEPKEGWEEDTLFNCCIKVNNIKWGRDTPSHKYIDLSSVDRETSNIYNTIVVSPNDAPSRAKQIVANGDIIFATTRPTLRRVALISEKYDGEICSTGFCVLRPKKHLLSKWIFYLLKADRFYNYIEPLQSGASYPAVTDTAVKGYIIDYPPLSEQQSIVDTLDSLKSKVDRLQENFNKISKECDALKQALLRQIFE